jgi:2-oxoglutarate ferredoxin oxidoreductase subunit delta
LASKLNTSPAQAAADICKSVSQRQEKYLGKGFQTMKKQVVKININTEWCKGCGICAAFCPKQVLALDQQEKSEAVRPEDCIGCLMCELRCPDLAIEVLTTPTQAESAS